MPGSSMRISSRAAKKASSSIVNSSSVDRFIILRSYQTSSTQVNGLENENELFDKVSQKFWPVSEACVAGAV